MNRRSWPRINGCLGRLTVVAIVAAVSLAAMPARGQSTAGVRLPPGFDEVLRPDYVRRDLQVVTTTLELDAVQQTILEQLFLDYETTVGAGNAAIQAELRERTTDLIAEQIAAQKERRDQYRVEMSVLVKEIRERQKQSRDARKSQALRDEFRKRAEALRAKIQQPTASASVRVTREFFDTIEQWRLDKTALGASMLDGVRAILSAGQSERWPALERQLMRQKRLGRGQLSGESLNLITLLQEIGIDAVTHAALGTVLGEYELALDEALRERSRRLTETSRNLIDAIVAEDDRRITVAIEREIEAHVAVRQVNDRYLEMLVSAMPPADGVRLLEAARRRAYPRLFSPTGSRRALSRSLALPDLTPDARRAIEQLDVAYRTELEVVARELVRQHRVQEPVTLGQSIRKRWGTGLAQPKRPDRATNDLLNRRRRLDLDTTEQLRGHLTARQAERVLGPADG